MVVGSGGRCHAIVDAFSRSRHVGKIYCAPGNAGIARLADCVPIGVTDIEKLADFAAENGIDLTVVGPEAALCAGIADVFNARGLKIFGPSKEAARIESSKEFAKEIMRKAGVPTAGYESFDDYEAALEYIKGRPLPAVIKYDGLAAGKGVVIAQTYEEAEKALREMLLDETFGKGRVVVEEFLEGPEFSFMCFVNGEKVYPLAVAQDHKRAYDGDRGPNTGGMGAYSPVPFVTPDIERESLEKIMKPVAQEMVKNGTPFLGVLYGGLILTAEGPKVIEFNARFGDPETEVVLPRLNSDLYEFIEAVMDRKDFTPEWQSAHYVGIVVAAKGYPGSYEKGMPIRPDSTKAIVYHMGTKEKDGEIVSAGGRVAIVVASASDPIRARYAALDATEKIATDDFFYRKDIARGMILDGRKYAGEVEEYDFQLVERNLKNAGRRPGLALVLVGDNPDSARYVGSKLKAAERAGVEAFEMRLDASIEESRLIEIIEELNADEEVDGIMVQLPLPSHLSAKRVIDAINPEKDVDGLSLENIGLLWSVGGGIVPCTPEGIFSLLMHHGIDPEGKEAVVVGRSNLVGLPVARLLLNANAGVTIVHSRTKNLGEITRRADILVVAAGSPGLITADMIKPGAAVVDVGINYNRETGRICGDVDFENARKVAGAITPVPGGVGPLTKAFLMDNTVKAWLNHTKEIRKSNNHD